MEPEGRLLCSQEPPAFLYPQPDQSSPRLPIQVPQDPQVSQIPKIYFQIILYLRLSLPSRLFPLGSLTVTLYAPLLSPIRAIAYFLILSLE